MNKNGLSSGSFHFILVEDEVIYKINKTCDVCAHTKCCEEEWDHESEVG